MPEASRLIVAACWLSASTAGSAVCRRRSGVGLASAGVLALALASNSRPRQFDRLLRRDEHVALQLTPELGFGAGQRLGPALALAFARAGRIEARAVFQRVGHVHVVRAVDRHRLLDLARWRIGVERDVGVGAERAAHVLEPADVPGSPNRRPGRTRRRRCARTPPWSRPALRCCRAVGQGIQRSAGLDVARLPGDVAEDRVEESWPAAGGASRSCIGR